MGRALLLRPENEIEERLAAIRRTDQMRRIRSENTRPELRVRRTVHALGFRFRLHRTDLPGTPDLVLPRLRKVIFVHGCFWHQHTGCRLARVPKKRLDYWLSKFERNRRRDSHVSDQLLKIGWEVRVVWECQTQDVLSLKALLEDMLGARVPSGSRSSETAQVSF
jgi:DNA mismatch endonuclease (patch repair protein)